MEFNLVFVGTDKVNKILNNNLIFERKQHNFYLPLLTLQITLGIISASSHHQAIPLGRVGLVGWAGRMIIYSEMNGWHHQATTPCLPTKSSRSLFICEGNSFGARIMGIWTEQSRVVVVGGAR